MTKNVFLLIIGLAFLISCNKNESPEFYIINGEIKNFEGKIYLIPAVDTLYYSNNFREDTATVVDGKFKFRLSTKFETPLPFRIRTDNSITNQFIMESKDQLIEIEEMSPMIKPSISCENSTVHSEDVSLAERRQASREELGIAMNSLNNSKFSNDSIQKLSDIAQEKFKENTLLIIKEFSKEYPKSYVSFWYLAMSEMIYGYDIAIENAYENLSPKIKKSNVAKLFEQKMLMSKISETGSPFAAN